MESWVLSSLKFGNTGDYDEVGKKGEERERILVEGLTASGLLGVGLILAGGLLRGSGAPSDGMAPRRAGGGAARLGDPYGGLALAARAMAMADRPGA